MFSGDVNHGQCKWWHEQLNDWDVWSGQLGSARRLCLLQAAGVLRNISDLTCTHTCSKGKRGQQCGCPADTRGFCQLVPVMPLALPARWYLEYPIRNTYPSCICTSETPGTRAHVTCVRARIVLPKVPMYVVYNGRTRTAPAKNGLQPDLLYIVHSKFADRPRRDSPYCV